MISEAIQTSPIDARTRRYREAERSMWEHYGLAPTERFVEIDRPRTRLRVLEIGSGPPILFLGGTGGTGPQWAPLIRELRGFRCVMLDRPGWGLSDPVDYANPDPKTVIGDVLAGALDALSLDRVHVVGASVGGNFAMRLASAYPARVDRIVLLAAGPIVPEMAPPPFIRMLASPVGAIIVRLPQKPARARSILRQLGHGKSLDAGRMDAYITWRVALERNTPSMRHERAMVRTFLRDGAWRAGVTFEDSELRAIGQPTLYVYGGDDAPGFAAIARHLQDRLPRAEVQLVEGGGHLSWFDEPGLVGNRIQQFLDG